MTSRVTNTPSSSVPTKHSALLPFTPSQMPNLYLWFIRSCGSVEIGLASTFSQKGAKSCRSASPPAEHRTCFIKEDPHVHRADTTVSIQLDCRCHLGVSRTCRVAPVQHNDAVALHNLPHGYGKLSHAPAPELHASTNYFHFVLHGMVFSPTFLIRCPFAATCLVRTSALQTSRWETLLQIWLSLQLQCPRSL